MNGTKRYGGCYTSKLHNEVNHYDAGWKQNCECYCHGRAIVAMTKIPRGLTADASRADLIIANGSIVKKRHVTNGWEFYSLTKKTTNNGEEHKDRAVVAESGGDSAVSAGVGNRPPYWRDPDFYCNGAACFGVCSPTVCANEVNEEGEVDV